MKRHWPVLVLVALALALRMVFFIGVIGSDDTLYASDAMALRQGSLVIGTSVVSMRILLLAAAAAAFHVAGVSEASMAVPAMAAAAFTLLTIYAIGTLLAGRAAGLVAAFLYSVTPVSILNSSTLLPELPMGALTALGVLLFLLALRAGRRPTAALLGLAAGVAVGLAYLIKEPAFLVLGAFVVVGVVRAVRGDALAWMYVLPVVGFGLVFVIENLVYLVRFGDVLHRFRTIDAGRQAILLESPGERQLTSLWVYPRSMFLVVNQLGLVFYFLLGFAVLAYRRSWRTSLLLVLWIVIPFLYLQFGSTSLRSYAGLPKQPRYLDAVMAPVVILLGAWTISWYRSSRASGRLVLSALLVVYVTTSLVFTAISTIDRRALTQPLRTATALLQGTDLRPVFATPVTADGLSTLLARDLPLPVPRMCATCQAGPCTPRTIPAVAEVWAVPMAPDGVVPPPPADCQRWGSQTAVALPLPALHHHAVTSIVGSLDRLPLPGTIRRETRPLRLLLEPRCLVITTPDAGTGSRLRERPPPCLSPPS